MMLSGVVYGGMVETDQLFAFVSACKPVVDSVDIHREILLIKNSLPHFGDICTLAKLGGSRGKPKEL